MATGSGCNGTAVTALVQPQALIDILLMISEKVFPWMKNWRGRQAESCMLCCTYPRRRPRRKSGELIGNELNSNYSALLVKTWSFDYCSLETLVGIKFVIYENPRNFDKMKEVATQNFQCIFQAYEILSNETKMQICQKSLLINKEQSHERSESARLDIKEHNDASTYRLASQERER
ncbi:hypothetical protein SAY87_011533 [Trapa incisa]|uniref:Uncharacterized protein n=1 Tax=Trapa incisa TaxID=236973 RepID=A0AAN7JBJ0_9MYRT|nr:hypothetical protein SAY87_011533 [Trapa incisa]